MDVFLRGPKDRLTLSGFNGIADARTKAASLLAGGRNTYRRANHTGTAVTGTYSFEVEPLGQGPRSVVQVTKTRHYYNQQVLLAQSRKQELQAVQSMLV